MSAQALPETAAVPWRTRVDGARLRQRGALWTATTAAHVVPFVAAGVLLVVLQPLAAAVTVIAFAHAWVIPELYAARGANVLRPVRRDPRAATAHTTALGLLADLVDHAARDRLATTGLVVEPGRLGTWVVGERGAVLLRGRRAFCYCVGVPDPTLPPADRTAHLLLALRADEQGFATVANLAFAGARWRVRRRLAPAMRPALRIP